MKMKMSLMFAIIALMCLNTAVEAGSFFSAKTTVRERDVCGETRLIARLRNKDRAHSCNTCRFGKCKCVATPTCAVPVSATPTCAVPVSATPTCAVPVSATPTCAVPVPATPTCTTANVQVSTHCTSSGCTVGNIKRYETSLSRFRLISR